MPLERASAAAVRLLDLGYFRIGSDAYTDANGSFGLTTLERRHVRCRGQRLVFSFTGKSGIEHTIEIETTWCGRRWTGCGDGAAAATGCWRTRTRAGGPRSTPRR